MNCLNIEIENLKKVYKKYEDVIKDIELNPNSQDIRINSSDPDANFKYVKLCLL